MDLGPHGVFIVMAYGATAVILAGLFLHAALDYRAQVRALARLEARGVRRRSELSQDPGGEERQIREAVG
jgi:heme exporter protein D